MNEKDFNDSVDEFFIEGTVFIVKQCIGLQKRILAIFQEKQEAEKYIATRKDCLDCEIDTVLFVSDSDTFSE